MNPVIPYAVFKRCQQALAPDSTDPYCYPTETAFPWLPDEDVIRYKAAKTVLSYLFQEVPNVAEAASVRVANVTEEVRAASVGAAAVIRALNLLAESVYLTFCCIAVYENRTPGPETPPPPSFVIPGDEDASGEINMPEPEGSN